MNQGLEILIARTKTHPEEFIGHENMSHVASKWLSMIENFEFYMTEEEKEAWQEAKEVLIEWRKVKRRDDFTEAVMKELLMREGEEEIGVALNSMTHPKKPRPTQLITAASLTHDALTILAGGGGGGNGGYGGGNYPQGGGGGSVIVKTPKGTHTFTKNGVVTINTDEEITWLPKS